MDSFFAVALSDIVKHRILEGKIEIDFDEKIKEHYLKFNSLHLNHTDTGVFITFLDPLGDVLFSLDQALLEGHTCTMNNISGRIRIQVETK